MALGREIFMAEAMTWLLRELEKNMSQMVK
jgi:hypothetical protein